MMSVARMNELIEKYKPALRVEIIHQSSPGYHLEINITGKGFKTLGRVPKSIFRKYELVLMDNQAGYMNISWYKFKIEDNGMDKTKAAEAAEIGEDPGLEFNGHQTAQQQQPGQPNQPDSPTGYTEGIH